MSVSHVVAGHMLRVLPAFPPGYPSSPVIDSAHFADGKTDRMGKALACKEAQPGSGLCFP